MQTEIVTIGELLIDMFPGKVGVPLGELDSFHPYPGGAPANVAVAASRLGANSAFIGKVGEDLFGHHLSEVLVREGVDIRGLRFDDQARTTLAFIVQPDERTADFVFYRNPGADQRLQPDELDLDLLKSTRILHFGTVSLTDEPIYTTTREAVRTARKSGALISCDVNYRPALWKSGAQALAALEVLLPEIDIIKVNETEAALLTGVDQLNPENRGGLLAAGRSLLMKGPQLAVITMGAQGSYFQIAGGGEFVPSFSVNSVDPVGCGDAFMAGLLSRFTNERPWKESLTFAFLKESLVYANAVGALTSLTQGAIPSMPDREQVVRFLKAGQSA